MNEQEKLSQELADKWGQRTRDALKPISELIGETMFQENALPFRFVRLSITGLLVFAIALATQAYGAAAAEQPLSDAEQPLSDTVH